MAHATQLALDPQTENEILAAIATLDWSTDIVARPLRIIQDLLGVPEKQAIDLLLSFQRRCLLICKAERPANNFAEAGEISAPVRGRWIQPTTI